jgi:predicted exporter
VAPAGIRMVDARVALAWVGDTESARLSRDARDAARATIEHDRVIGVAIAQGVTPIPASLSDPYDDDASMLADLAGHARDIEAALPAVQGKVEMTTIVALRDESPAANTPERGKAYLEQLRSRPTRIAAIADRVESELRSVAGEARRRADADKTALSHLIPREAIDLYSTVALGGADAGYRIVVDGPRAPYSFALYAPRRGTILAT